MTPEEAINCIKDVLGSDYHYDETLGYQLTSDDFEWLELAIEALEKQIPKKPKKYSDIGAVGELRYTLYKCPNCGVKNINDDIYYKHCPSCGQALKWGEEE